MIRNATARIEKIPSAGVMSISGVRYAPRRNAACTCHMVLLLAVEAMAGSSTASSQIRGGPLVNRVTLSTICRKDGRQRRVVLSGKLIDLAAAPLIRRLENS